MNNFMFGLSEIGGQTSPIQVTTNDETKDQNPDPCDDESDEINNLKNLFLSFKPHLNLFLLPVYYN